MRVPRVAGFGLNLGKTGPRRRVGNAYQVLTSRTLNLFAGMARVTFQGLIAVGTIEFEFVHSLHLYMRKPTAKSMWRNVNTFCPPIAHVEADEQNIHANSPGT